MRRSRILFMALALVASAGLAFGQSTAKTTYKIAVVAPNEGETLAPDQVRVVLTPSSLAMGDSKTQVDVFLDDQQKGVINASETEFRVEGVNPGPHKLVLVARNPVSDAVFDRREINFVASGDSKSNGMSSVSESAVGAQVPPAVSSTDKQHTYTATDATGSAQSTSVAEVRPASSSSSYSSSTSSSTSSYSAPAPAPGSYGSNAPASVPSSTDKARLPKTASSDALLALAGAALVVTGALLRRGA